MGEPPNSNLAESSASDIGCSGALSANPSNRPAAATVNCMSETVMSGYQNQNDQHRVHNESNLHGSVGAGGGAAGLGEGAAKGGAWEGSLTIGMGANMSTEEVCDTVVVEVSISKPNKSTSGGGATGAGAGVGADRTSDLTGPEMVWCSCGDAIAEG